MTTDTKQLRKLAQAAPLPIHVGGKEKSTIYDNLGQRVANSFEGVMATQKTDAQCQSFAAFIVAACNALPELLDTIEAQKKLLERANDAFVHGAKWLSIEASCTVTAITEHLKD